MSSPPFPATSRIVPKNTWKDLTRWERSNLLASAKYAMRARMERPPAYSPRSDLGEPDSWYDKPAIRRAAEAGLFCVYRWVRGRQYLSFRILAGVEDCSWAVGLWNPASGILAIGDEHLSVPLIGDAVAAVIEYVEETAAYPQ